MRSLALRVVLVVAIGSMNVTHARACDPYWDWEWCFGYDPAPISYEPTWSEPAYAPQIDGWSPPSGDTAYDSAVFVAYEAPVVAPAVTIAAPAPAQLPAPAPPPAPVAYIPASAPAVIWTAPTVDVLAAWQPAPTPTPASPPQPTPVPRQPDVLAADLGLHRVTDVWAGDVVITQGPVTTYTTNTVHQDAGTYATLVASVGTGERSAYDALLSNPRSALTDGRPVKGDVYANYVWSGSAIVLDRYVFFQDDLEIARLLAIPSPVPTALPMPLPGATPTIGAPPPSAPPAVTTLPPAPGGSDLPPAPGGSDPVTTMPGPSPTPIPPRVVRAGVALSPQGDVLGRIEVLRGRRVDLWPRGTVDGAPARVASWRLASGEVTALGPLSGTADEPFAAMWEHLAPPGSAFTLRVVVTIDVAGEGLRSVDATIDVIVRSPALVE